MPDLYQKHRPKRFKDVVGQPQAVSVLTNMMANGGLPHCILMSGPSGTGKTTLARILKTKLKCIDSDYKEINAADHRGIEQARDIINNSRMAAWGEFKIYTIDEFHQMTKEAKDCLLKVLEDAPKHAYFFLCTTESIKLPKTIITRCLDIKLKPVGIKDLCSLITTVMTKEDKQSADEVIEKIAEYAEGSPRLALRILEKVIDLKTADEQLDAIEKASSKVATFELVKALLPFKGTPNWGSVKTVLDSIADEEPEGVRRLILKVCETSMLKGGAYGHRAFLAYQSFRDNYFDTGRTGLVASCWEVVNSLNGKGR